MGAAQREVQLQDWLKRTELAEKMIPIIGKLYREREVEITLYGKSLNNSGVIEILKAHRWVRQIENTELYITDSFPILESIAKLDLSPCRIDLGKLAITYLESDKSKNLDDFTAGELAEANKGKANALKEPQDVVLYGFGRIGRLMARLLIKESGNGKQLRLGAIVVRKGKAPNDLEKRASLLRRDSVHGAFEGTIKVDEENQALIINGSYVQVIYSNSPTDVDYTQFGIKDAIVVDNTGVWRDEAGLGQHLKAKGVKSVVLTAPGKGDIKNIVFGVNDDTMSLEDRILSAASCTTNAIVPVLKAVNDEFEIKAGHVETVHAYTNDQNLIDNYHKAERRGRAAALNMVLTETGAAKAVAKALPELAGKLTGNAIRVPTPNVSMAILNLELGKNTSKEDLNNYLRYVALFSKLQEQVDYTASTEVVSSDLVGTPYAGIVDSKATIVNGNRCVLYVWYDNEFGYSCQVMKVVKKMAGLTMLSMP